MHCSVQGSTCFEMARDAENNCDNCQSLLWSQLLPEKRKKLEKLNTIHDNKVASQQRTDKRRLDEQKRARDIKAKHRLGSKVRGKSCKTILCFWRPFVWILKDTS